MRPFWRRISRTVLRFALALLACSLDAQTQDGKDPEIESVSISNGKDKDKGKIALRIDGRKLLSSSPPRIGIKPLEITESDSQKLVARASEIEPGTYLLQLETATKKLECAVEVGGQDATFLVALDAPKLSLEVSTSGDKIFLTWSAWPHATSYSVKKSDKREGPYTEVQGGLRELKYTDSRKPENPVFYLVSARSGATQVHSEPLSTETLPTGPILLAAGWYHNLAVKAGTVSAWGSNSHGQLGNGRSGVTPTDGEGVKDTSADSAKGVKIRELPEVHSLAAGLSFSVAANPSGVWTLGANSSGQLGNGTVANSSVPVKAQGTEHCVKVAAGAGHVLAVDTEAHVLAWGLNSWGQLGLGNLKDSYTPQRVQGLEKVTAVAAGDFHSLALTEDGKVYSWGLGSDGQLGQGQNGTQKNPVPVLLPEKATALAAGASHSLALLLDGRVFAWGSNKFGQLGIGTHDEQGKSTARLTPVLVSGIECVDSIAAGGNVSLAWGMEAKGKDHYLWAWGSNRFGQLGSGNTDDSDLPVKVKFAPQQKSDKVVAFAVGRQHVIVGSEKKELFSWGSNSNGQLGKPRKAKDDAKEPLTKTAELVDPIEN